MAPAFSEAVRAFYEKYDEANRLASGVFQLEYARTLEILQRHLPPPPAVVLDVGGGPGVYSCWLAQQGYEAHLLDPVPSHLEQARQRAAQQPHAPVAGFALGEARQLDFADHRFDAVLLMGPLYHLLGREERVAALREARRVLRRGGVLCAAAISRFASACDGLFQNLLPDRRFAAIVQNDLRDGRHLNPTGELKYFTESYFHRPEELAEEMTAAGLQHERTLAIEGLGWLLQNFEEWWQDQTRRAQLLGLLRQLESEPSLLGASAHLMAIARK